MSLKARKILTAFLTALAVGLGVLIVSDRDTGRLKPSASGVSGTNPPQTEAITFPSTQPASAPKESADSGSTMAPKKVASDPAPLLPDALFDRAILLADRSETINTEQIRRTRVWETDGSIPFIRTVEVIAWNHRGDETVESRLAMVADQVLIQLTDSEPDLATLDRLAAIGFELSENVTGSGLFRAGLSDFRNPNQMTVALRKVSAAIETVRFAEPDYLITASALPSDPLFQQQWGLNMAGSAVDGDIDAPEAWESRTDSSQAVVAIIDSGIRLTHEDLVGSLWTNSSEVASNGIDDDGNGVIDDVHGLNVIESSGNPGDDNGHGTQVAGIVGAVGNNAIGISGVSWTARLMAIKFLDADGMGTTSDAITSIDYAIAEGASVINASWGSDARSIALESAISRAADAGVLMVAAAGNEARNIDVSPVYPASYDSSNIIAVAATDRNGHLAEFSNWGRSSVILGAPGVSILSTAAENDDAYMTISGTSAAVPFVTGAVALLIAEGSPGGIAGIRSRIIRNGKPIANLLTTTASGGMLSVGNALANRRLSEPHDAFSDPALILGFDVRLSLHPGRATSEPNEPQHGSQSEQGTLWLSWSPPVPATVSLTSSDPLGSAEVAVYTGADLGSLVRLASGSNPSPAQFNAAAGVQYRFAVSSPPSDTINPVEFHLMARASNDDIEQAPVLVDESFRLVGSTENATREVGEPDLTGRGLTVWWQLIPPVSGVYTIGFSEIQATAVLRLFTRESAGPTGLMPVSPIVGSLEVAQVRAFDLVKGRAYFIGVDSIHDRGDLFTIEGRLARLPFIARQPQDTQIRRSNALALSVKALGTPPLAYQWRINGEAIPGQTDSTLLIPDIGLDQGGAYSVRISSPTGAITSRSAVVTVLPPTLRIVQQPRDVSAAAGRDAGFAVLATGEGELSYQWLRNNAPISGATASHLTVSNITGSDVGPYSVEVSSPFLSVRSAEAELRLATDESEDWVWRLPESPGVDFNASTFSDGLFVIAGRTGVVGTSTDGLSWVYSQIPEVFDVYHIGRIGSNWIFVGSRKSWGGIYAYLTADFVSWNRVTVGPGTAWDSVFASNGDRAILSRDSLYTTTDGIIWRKVENGPTHLSGAAWANGRFMVISDHPSGNGIFTSPNGEDWENVSQDRWSKRIFSDGDWFFIDTTRSKDGILWEELSANHSKPTTMAAKGIFVQVRSPGDPVLVSEDATRWTPVSSGDTSTATAEITTVASNGTTFILAGKAGAIATGTNQDSAAFLTSTAPGVKLFAAGDLVFALGQESYFSSTGLNWTKIPHPGHLGEFWRAVFHQGDQFLLVDSESAVFAGSTPLSLTPTGFTLGNSTAFGFGKFFRINGSKIEQSTDAQSWAAVADAPAGFGLRESYFVGDRLYLCDFNNALVTVDGIVWTTVDLLDSVRAIAWSGSRFAAVIENGRIATSTDGISWVLATNAPAGAFTIAYGDGRFVVGTVDGSYYDSTNLSTWIKRGTISGSGGRIIFAKNRFLLTANSAGSGRFPVTHASGQGIQTLGGPAGLSPVLALDGIETGAYTLPLYSRLNSRPIAVDPDGNLSEVTLTVSGPSSWLTEDPDGRFTYDPSTAGEQFLTIRASDTAGNVSTEYLQIHVQSPVAVPELPIGYLGRMNTAVLFHGAWWVFGRDAIAARSQDGLNWEHYRLDPSAAILDAAVSGDILAGVTLDHRLVGSVDGLNWNEIRSAPADPEQSFPKLIKSGNRVYYRETRFSSLTSSNGRDWEPATGLGGVVSIAVENGMTIARTTEGGWFFSSDGMAFAPLDSPYTESPFRIDAVVAGNGLFVILGRDGRVFRSGDPSDGWTASMTLDVPIMAGGSLEFIGGRFYLGQRSFPAKAPAFASVDASNWLESEPPPSLEVIVEDGRLIATGTPDLTTSLDGLKWDVDPTKPGAPGGIIPGARGYLSFRGGSGGNLWFDGGQSSFSVDGVIWSNPLRIGSAADPRVVSISSLADRRFLVDTVGVRVSRSFGPWMPLNVGGDPVRYAAASDSIALALTQNRGIWITSNGSEWTKASTAPAEVDPAGAVMISAGDRFFLTTNQNNLLWSTDGQTWTAAGLPAGTSGPIRGVTHGSGAWIVTKGADLYRSTDLAHWSSRTDLGATGPARFLNDRFYLPVQGGYRDSSDGSSWSFHTIDLRTSYFRVARLHGGVVLFKTDPENPPIGSATIFTGTYDILTGSRMGENEFSGSPYIYDGIEAGTETYLVGHQGTLLRVPRLDLRIESIAVEPGALAPGNTFRADVVIRNPSPETIPVESFGSVELFLTTDDTIGGVQLGTLPFMLTEPLGPGVIHELSGEITVPDLLRPGTYRLGAILTSNLVEANLQNNRLIDEQVTFGFSPRTLSVTVEGPGRLLGVDDTEMKLATGSRVALVPVAEAGGHFVRWEGDTDGGIGAITLQMNTDRAVKAIFSNYLKLGLSVDGGGTILTDIDPNRLTAGARILAEAIPDAGWFFQGWTGANESSQAIIEVTMRTDENAEAHFMRTRQSYLDFHFTEEEQIDPDIAGDQADPDHDGLDNLTEFIFDLDPRGFDQTPVFQTYRDGSDLCFLYPRSRYLDGWALTPQFSSNLQEWQSDRLTEKIIKSDGIFDYVEARSAGGASREGFFRLQVISPSEQEP